MTVRTLRQKATAMDNPRREVWRARLLTRKVATAEEAGRGRLYFDWQTMRGVMNGKFHDAYRKAIRRHMRVMFDELPDDEKPF